MKTHYLAIQKNYTATSDYFNADELAQKIVSVLTAKGMGKLSIGETFAIGNPENYMTYQKSLYNFDREEAGININILPQKGYIVTSIEATDYIVNFKTIKTKYNLILRLKSTKYP